MHRPSIVWVAIDWSVRSCGSLFGNLDRKHFKLPCNVPNTRVEFFVWLTNYVYEPIWEFQDAGRIDRRSQVIRAPSQIRQSKAFLNARPLTVTSVMFGVSFPCFHI